MYRTCHVVLFPYRLEYMTDIGSPGRMKADMIWMKYLTEMLNPVVAVTSIGLVRMAER
jgi:hypothetical protein